MDKTIGLRLVIGAALGKSFRAAFDTAAATSTKLGEAWKKTNAKLGAANDVIRYKEKLNQLKAKQAELGHSSERMQQGIAEVERRYKSAKREAKGYGISIGSVVREQRVLQRELKKTERIQKAMAGKAAAASRFGALRGRMLGGIGVAYGAARLGGKAMDIEEQGAYLKTVINARDGNRQAAVGRALEHARKFARGSLASDSEVLTIEYALNSAGLNEDVARTGTELVHKLAKVTKGSAEQVGEIVGVTFNNMGASMLGTAEQKMNQIGNILAKTQFKYQIRDFGQLGESMKFAAASAASAKLPLAQTAALIGQLNSAGLQGTMAGTSFSGMLRNLTKASEELGFEIVRDSKGMLDMVATLDGMNNAVDGMQTDELSDLLQTLFGDEGKRAVVPLLEKLPQLKAGVKELNDIANGSLVSDEYADFLNTTAGQWTRFKNNALQVGTVFAGTLLPAFNAVLKPLVKLGGWIAEGIQKYPVIGHVIGGIGTVILMYGAGLGVATAAQWLFNTAIIRSHVGFVKTVAGLIWAGAVFTANAVKIGTITAAQWLWNAALNANPIGLVIAGVAALAGGAFLLYKNWDSVMGWFSETLDWLGDKFSWVGDVWNSMFGDGKAVDVKVGANKPKAGPSRTGSLAAAGMAGIMATTPAAAPADITQHNSYQIAIHAQPGQDGAALADEMQREIARREAAKGRAAMHDGGDL